MIRYDEEKLRKDPAMNSGRPFQQCSISVMDTIADPDITFDENGVCNYYHDYKRDSVNHLVYGEAGMKKLNDAFEKIRTEGKNKKYDCILGLSGGVDSTYLCLLAKQNGLRPLVVHCDNGWNSELAVNNIENTINKLGFDLFTYVIDWEEFKEMQLAYLKASVVDIEVLTDHAFMAVLYRQAKQWNINYVLTGMNMQTEYVLPKFWRFTKSDTKNLKAIVSRFSRLPLKSIKTFPFLDYNTRVYCEKVLKIKSVEPLNYMDYNYKDVKDVIAKELDWRDYGGKHYESVWTRFYQGYILPAKFGIDKRKAHLSNLIFSGQLTKAEAVAKLAEPNYDPELFRQDYDFVLKKFGLTESEFDEIMRRPRREHAEYPTQKLFGERNPRLRKFIRQLFGK